MALSAVELDLAMHFPDGKRLSFDDANRLLSAVKLGPFPFAQQTYSACIDEDGDLPTPSVTMKQILRAQLPDRDDPSHTVSLVFSVQAPLPAALLTRGYLLDMVRRFLVRIATHEMNEQIFVGGTRVFDPHVDGRTDL